MRQKRTRKQKEAWAWRYCNMSFSHLEKQPGCQYIGNAIVCNPFNTPWHDFVDDKIQFGTDRWSRRLRAAWRKKVWDVRISKRLKKLQEAAGL